MDFDATYGFPVIRAVLKNEKVPTKQITVAQGKIFNPTLLSCLKKMNKILEKENLKLTSTQEHVAIIHDQPSKITDFRKYGI